MAEEGLIASYGHNYDPMQNWHPGDVDPEEEENYDKVKKWMTKYYRGFDTVTDMVKAAQRKFRVKGHWVNRMADDIWRPEY